METAGFSETLVLCYQITRHGIQRSNNKAIRVQYFSPLVGSFTFVYLKIANIRLHFIACKIRKLVSP